MDEFEVIDQLIDCLSTNQDILDSGRKIKNGDLKVLMSELNYSFLEILKNIKINIDSRVEEPVNKETQISNLYA